MRKRIVHNLLKMHQQKVIQQPPQHLLRLYQHSYRLINNLIVDIKRPFLDVCIHGRQSSLLLPYIQAHNKQYNVNPKQCRITLVDHMRNIQFQKLFEQGKVKQLRYLDNSDLWLPEQNHFDCIISNLRTHHANQQEQLFTKYQRTLKADGTLMGCGLVQGTLQQLYWSYILAQNQRHGGMSPKILQLPPIGQFGSCLTSAEFKLVTILSHDQVLELDSFPDLLTLLQQVGQSGYLRGRRKGVFKDLLLAAAALYTSQFSNQQGKINATISLCSFIGWKFDKSQPKPLRPGAQVGSIQFSQELSKFGQVQTFDIDESTGQAKPRK